MPITTIIKLAGLAAILGGSLRVLTSFLPPMPVVALELLYLAVDLPLLLAVLGIYADQRRYTGRTAFAGFLLAVAGFALIVGPDGNLGPVAVYPVGALAISAGLCLLGAAAWPARRLPRATTVLWFIAAATGFGAAAGAPLAPIAGVAFGLAFAIAGARMLVPITAEPGTDTPPHAPTSARTSRGSTPRLRAPR